MLTKHADLAEVDRHLEQAAVMYKRRKSRLDPTPQNFLWIAGTIESQLANAAPGDLVDLYWSFAVVLWAGNQKSLARKAAKAHLGLMPASELDRAITGARERLRKTLLAITPPGRRGNPHARQGASRKAPPRRRP